MRRKHDDDSVRITSAQRPRSEDINGRQRRYLISMGIRTVCFVLAAVTATQGAPWWLWGSFAVAAIVLPYVAVVLANAVRPRLPGSSAPVTPRGDGPDQIGR